MNRVPFSLCVFAAVLGGGCVSPEEQLARRLIEPASLAYAMMADGPGTAAAAKFAGRYDHARQVNAPNGVPLAVWVISNRKPGSPARTAVLLHPLLASKTWLLAMGQELASRGWDVVLPDLRAHGSSGGKYVTWGAKEKYDVKAVVDSLAAEGLIHGPLYVFGASQGAATAIQYAAVDPRCKGVVAVAPPQSCREITRRILLGFGEADHADAIARAERIADFKADDASAEAAAAKLACPLILIHGKLDLVVPYSHGQAVFNAAPQPKKLITLPADGHGPEVPRAAWMADRVEELAAMAR